MTGQQDRYSIPRLRQRQHHLGQPTSQRSGNLRHLVDPSETTMESIEDLPSPVGRLFGEKF